MVLLDVGLTWVHTPPLPVAKEKILMRVKVLMSVSSIASPTRQRCPEEEGNGLLDTPKKGESAKGAVGGDSTSIVQLMAGQSKNIVSAGSTKLASHRLRFTVQLGDMTRTTRLERCGQDAVWDKMFSFSTKWTSSQQIHIIAEEKISSGGFR